MEIVRLALTLPLMAVAQVGEVMAGTSAAEVAEAAASPQPGLMARPQQVAQAARAGPVGSLTQGRKMAAVVPPEIVAAVAAVAAGMRMHVPAVALFLVVAAVADMVRAHPLSLVAVRFSVAAAELAEVVRLAFRSLAVTAALPGQMAASLLVAAVGRRLAPMDRSL